MLRPLLLLSCALLASLASASGGHYAVTFAPADRGRMTIDPDPYAISPQTYPDIPVFIGTGVWDAASGKKAVSCSGLCRATFTWVPGPQNDPVPPVAVVHERSYASWKARDPGGPGGLGGPLGLPGLRDRTSPTRAGARARRACRGRRGRRRASLRARPARPRRARSTRW